MQIEYWTANPAELHTLKSKGSQALKWPARLRLHHLACLALLADGAAKEQFEEGELGDDELPSSPQLGLVQETTSLLYANDSPFRPRVAAVWQGALEPKRQRQPNAFGVCSNASLTHLGCLEVITLDDKNMPISLEFLAFDEIQSIAMATPAQFRMSRILLEGGADIMALVPLQYGVSWKSPNDFDHDGSMTRFIGMITPSGSSSSVGIGVGQQDLTCESEGAATLMGLSSVSQIEIVLDMRDPKFDEKCRGRGIDPIEARKRSR
ncbi:hypothetical protein PLCT2_00413 [Planctomycetaceae bacterium]|nr:hypothetical protein PLCT2_00413 [Planctomycetaceae bacterium]